VEGLQGCIVSFLDQGTEGVERLSGDRRLDAACVRSRLDTPGLALEGEPILYGVLGQDEQCCQSSNRAHATAVCSDNALP
jgi:hypothetical protein